MARQAWKAKIKKGVKEMVYQWINNAHIKSDANVAGAMFEQLENTIGLTPQNLLDANRAEDAPMHNDFEWNDSVAAEEYRLTQARYMIRMLVFKPETEEVDATPQRAYFKVSSDDGYENLSVIIKNEDMYNALMKQAQKELSAFRNKYKMLKEYLRFLKQLKG